MFERISLKLETNLPEVKVGLYVLKGHKDEILSQFPIMPPPYVVLFMYYVFYYRNGEYIAYDYKFDIKGIIEWSKYMLRPIIDYTTNAYHCNSSETIILSIPNNDSQIIEKYALIAKDIKRMDFIEFFVLINETYSLTYCKDSKIHTIPFDLSNIEYDIRKLLVDKYEVAELSRIQFHRLMISNTAALISLMKFDRIEELIADIPVFLSNKSFSELATASPRVNPKVFHPFI